MIVLFSATLKLIEDRSRRKADHTANSRGIERLLGNEAPREGRLFACWRKGAPDPDPAQMQRITWTEVKVGDVLLIKNRELLPADLLILAVHEPDAERPSGVCHVETKASETDAPPPSSAERPPVHRARYLARPFALEGLLTLQDLLLCRDSTERPA